MLFPVGFYLIPNLRQLVEFQTKYFATGKERKENQSSQLVAQPHGADLVEGKAVW